MENSGQWATIFACFSIYFLVLGPARVASLYYVELLERFNISREQASLPFVLVYTTMHSLGPFFGYLATKFGYQEITMTGCVLAAIGIGICFFAEHIITVTIFWGLIHGLGYGLGGVFLPSIINEHIPRKHQSKAQGISISGATVGTIILPYFVEYFIENYGVSESFLVLSALMLNAVPAAMLLKNKNIKQHKEKINENELLDILIENKCSVAQQNLEVPNKVAPDCTHESWEKDVKNQVLVDDHDAMEDNFVEYDEFSSGNNFDRNHHQSDKINHQMTSETNAETKITPSSNTSAKTLDGEILVGLLQLQQSTSEQITFTQKENKPDKAKGIPLNLNQNKRLSNTQQKINTSLHEESLGMLQQNTSEQITFAQKENNPDEVKDILLNLKLDKRLSNTPLHEESLGLLQQSTSEQITFTLKENNPDEAKDIPLNLKLNKRLSNTQQMCGISNVTSAYELTNPEYKPKKCFVFSRKPTNQNTALRAFRLLLNKTFITIVISQSIFAFILGTFWTIMIDILLDANIDKAVAINFHTVFMVVDIIGRCCLGYAVDKRWMTYTNFGIVVFISVGTSFILTTLPFGKVFLVFALLMTSFLIGGLVTYLLGAIEEFIEDDQKSMAMASRRMFYLPLSFATSPLIGYFREVRGSYRGLLYVLASASYLCALLVFVVLRLYTKRKTDANQTVLLKRNT